MGFELVQRSSAFPHRKYRPAKISVFHAGNGGSQIRLSAATRDWLEPSPGDQGARWPGNLPAMKVALLVDKDAHQLMIRRCADEDTGTHVYNVAGLSPGNQALISDRGLEHTIGLVAGHYLCELIEDGADLTRAAVVGLDEGTPPTTRNTRLAQTDASPLPIADEEHRRIAEIRAVLDEGINLAFPDEASSQV